MDVYAGGRPEAAEHEDEVVLRDTRSGTYRKLILDGDRLTGAILMGTATGDARRCSAALRGELAVAELLQPPAAQATGELDPQALVCSCNAVTAGAIHDAIRSRGLTTVASGRQRHSRSTGCGGCAGDVRELLARHA